MKAYEAREAADKALVIEKNHKDTKENVLVDEYYRIAIEFIKTACAEGKYAASVCYNYDEEFPNQRNLDAHENSMRKAGARLSEKGYKKSFYHNEQAQIMILEVKWE